MVTVKPDGVMWWGVREEPVQLCCEILVFSVFPNFHHFPREHFRDLKKIGVFRELLSMSVGNLVQFDRIQRDCWALMEVCTLLTAILAITVTMTTNILHLRDLCLNHTKPWLLHKITCVFIIVMSEDLNCVWYNLNPSIRIFRMEELLVCPDVITCDEQWHLIKHRIRVNLPMSLSNVCNIGYKDFFFAIKKDWHEGLFKN